MSGLSGGYHYMLEDLLSFLSQHLASLLTPNTMTYPGVSTPPLTTSSTSHGPLSLDVEGVPRAG